MPATDITEKGLETLIMRHLTGSDGLFAAAGGLAETSDTPNTARIEHDQALQKAMLDLLKDDTEVYKQFAQNESFKRFVSDMVFDLTNQKGAPASKAA